MNDDSDYVPNTETENETETDTDLEILEDDYQLDQRRFEPGKSPFELFNGIDRQRSRATSLCGFIDDESETSECDQHDMYSIDTHSSPISLFDVDDEDYCCIIEDMYLEFDAYYESNILHMSSPKFYIVMIEYITELYHTYWNEIQICDEDDYDDVYELVEQIYDTYVIFSGIPKRSIPIDDVIVASGLSGCGVVVVVVDSGVIRQKICHLQNIPQPAQRTPEWYEFRNNLISASNLWKVFGTESQINSIIYEKCRPIAEQFSYASFSNNTEGSMHWGVKYEPVSAMLYESMYNTKLGEFGCIQHPKYPFIGASPDGINIDETNSERYGRMVEIKNIFNREITGIPKQEYWIQTQIQMETCDLDECDFVETRFKEYVDERSFYEDDEHIYKGVILAFHHITTSSGATIYRYMPLNAIRDKESVDEWIYNTCEKCREEGISLFSVAYWYLDCISCVLIQRNRRWFDAAIPVIKKTWKVIEIERKTGYTHRAPASSMKQDKNKISVNVDLSNSYLIRNMPAANSICLVKLDF